MHCKNDWFKRRRKSLAKNSQLLRKRLSILNFEKFLPVNLDLKQLSSSMSSNAVSKTKLNSSNGEKISIIAFDESSKDQNVTSVTHMAIPLNLRSNIDIVLACQPSWTSLKLQWHLKMSKLKNLMLTCAIISRNILSWKSENSVKLNHLFTRLWSNQPERMVQNLLEAVSISNLIKSHNPI